VTDITTLPIELLRRRADARKINDGALSSLAESIEEIGLINPIRVRRVGEGYEVIAGSHRLSACDLVGLRNIPCIIVMDDDLHAELAMIDENLMRNELSASDRAVQTARRKAIYLELHPETAAGTAQAAGMNAAQQRGGQVGHDVNRFDEATAKATGQSERAVRRDAERGEKVIPEALAIIRGTRLDTGVYLDKLKKLSPNDQVTAAKRDLVAEKKRAEEPLPQGGLAARYRQAAPDPAKSAERFVLLADQIEAIPVEELLSSGRMRATVGQRASGLADHLSEIVEQLDR
jgi:ParB-like chromosome segregation protein Spo0J